MFINMFCYILVLIPLCAVVADGQGKPDKKYNFYGGL